MLYKTYYTILYTILNIRYTLYFTLSTILYCEWVAVNLCRKEAADCLRVVWGGGCEPLQERTCCLFLCGVRWQLWTCVGKSKRAVSWLCEGAAVNLCRKEIALTIFVWCEGAVVNFCRKEIALTVSVMCEGAAVNFCRKGTACCLLVVWGGGCEPLQERSFSNYFCVVWGGGCELFYERTSLPSLRCVRGRL